MRKRTAGKAVLIFAIIACLVILAAQSERKQAPVKRKDRAVRVVSGTVRKGDALSRIFTRNKLRFADLQRAKKAAEGVYDLGELCSGRPYTITIDDEDRLDSLTYWMDDETYMNLSRQGDSLTATVEKVEYEKRLLSFGGMIKDSLIASLGPEKEALRLALDLSDIFAWDIDFTTDLRDGDTFKVIVEGLFVGNTFRKFGDILSAEFVNDGRRYMAYRYEVNGSANYYDAGGTPLRKAFLKAPLNFRRISSSYSGRRLHPVLKKYRPHHGIDYAAASGTPVSALGDGEILFAGYRGSYGKLVIIKHRNGYSTYYGHLSRIGKGIARRARVAQGEVIGFVGATGLATGPHLHLEIRVAGKPVNPLSLRPLCGEPLQGVDGDGFRELVVSMDHRLETTQITNGTPVRSMLAVQTRMKGD
jgi:murein DD-endopeptidase MepM/ murein hydrolase activator NlpD